MLLLQVILLHMIVEQSVRGPARLGPEPDWTHPDLALAWPTGIHKQVGEASSGKQPP